MLGQVIFIVWRESIEALLIIGILFAWLQNNPAAAAGRKYLWAGIVGGILAAVALGSLLLFFAELFDGERQDYFQIGMMSVAAALIVQMVFWMRQHGKTLKRELEQGLNQQLQMSRWWGMALLVMIAVTREGSETVVFLYGMGLAQSGMQWFGFAGAALAGFLLALATFQMLQLGGRIFSWNAFFRVTEIMLLLLAGALLVNCVERMIGLGWLPALVDPVWDTSGVLDDATKTGGVISALTGYRAQPALLTLLMLSGYWVLVVLGLNISKIGGGKNHQK